MSIKEQKAKIKSKIDAVKKINDDAKQSIDSGKAFVGSIPDKLASKVPNFNGKNLSDLISKRAKKKETQTDIFQDLIDTVEGFLGTAPKNPTVDYSDRAFSKQRLKQITQESAHETIKSSKTIVMEGVQKILFAGDGICGTQKSFTGTTVTLSPTEFDFMNVLTIDPTSSTGKIVYEQTTPSGYVKMNRMLYDGFSTPTSQPFTTKNGDSLFSFSWDTNNQQYNISGLSINPSNAITGSTIQGFFNDYYSNIENIDMSGVTKMAMLMTINADGSEPPLFNVGLDNLTRLLKKICANCGAPDVGLKQNATTQFNENDQESEFYFDFDDVEGIDLDDESNRRNRVLKFRDCNDFTTQISSTHFEDFVYLSKNKNLNDVVSKTLYNAAADAHDQTNDSIPVDNFHISLLSSFILNLPKALIATVLSPKYFLPIVIVYKQLVSEGGNVINDVKVMMKKLHKLFNYIINQLFWKFLAEFWSRVKKDLIEFLAIFAAKILVNKTKKYVLIISSLIALLTKLLETDLTNCETLYGLINSTINSALMGALSLIQIPPTLLLTSALRDGYSADRAYMNAMENLNGAGIDTSDKFGVPSQVGDFVKGIIDGHTKEHDTNAKVSVYGANPLAGPSFGISH
jgi:hypothetical protein